MSSLGVGSVILGIESSCDETGAGLVRIGDDGVPVLLGAALASSADEHVRFGGVVPEIASRAHVQAMLPTIRSAFAHADLPMGAVDAVAVTAGPGLAGALLVGVATAKALAAAWQVPLYGVNHLDGHIAADLLEHGALPTPALALLVSGGHTQLLRIDDISGQVTEIGSTVDDAAGEAYDKVARMLGLGYPGGPVIDCRARQGNPDAIAFPRALTGPRDAPYDYSFSGLKTAVARYVESHPGAEVDDICASFQEAVCDVLTAKCVRAATDLGISTVLIAGGVAANGRLRELAESRCAAAGVRLRVPPLSLCTDNGAMMAALGAMVAAAGGPVAPETLGADPSLEVATVAVG